MHLIGDYSRTEARGVGVADMPNRSMVMGVSRSSEVFRFGFSVVNGQAKRGVGGRKRWRMTSQTMDGMGPSRNITSQNTIRSKRRAAQAQQRHSLRVRTQTPPDRR